MKHLLTTLLVIFLSTIVFAQETNIKLLDSKYHYISSEYKTYFKRLISLNGTTYYIEGNITFDDEGKTIQKLDKFKKNTKYTKIEDSNYVQMSKDPTFKEYTGIIYIQFKNIKQDKEHIKKVVSLLDKELELNNSAVNNDFNFDKGVGIAEYFVKDFDVAFQTIFGTLQKEGMTDDILLGQRVYMDGDDYNVEILYPIKYEGTFWGF